MTSDWRTDPRWTLMQWVEGHWSSPPLKPTPQAELTGGGDYADHFVDHRSVATWWKDPSAATSSS